MVFSEFISSFHFNMICEEPDPFLHDEDDDKDVQLKGEEDRHNFLKISTQTLFKAWQSLEVLLSKVASKYNVTVSTSVKKQTDVPQTMPTTASSRFLSKMNILEEGNFDEKNPRCISVAFKGECQDSVEHCKNEVLHSLLFGVDEESFLLSFKFIPKLETMQVENLPFTVYDAATYYLLVSPSISMHLDARSFWAEQMCIREYVMHAMNLSIDEIISLLVYAGPFHLNLQSYLSKEPQVLLPSPVIFESKGDRLFILGKDQTAKRLCSDLMDGAKKTQIFSKNIDIETADLFLLLNTKETKSRLMDLLFRNGCVMRIASSSSFSELSVFFYASSIETADEVSKEVLSLICINSNQLEIIYSHLSSVFNPIQAALSSYQVGGCMLITFAAQENDRFQLSLKGSKTLIFNFLSSSQLFSHFSTLFDGGDDQCLDFYSPFSGSSLVFVYRVGTLAVDCDFISGKKDGKLAKISRETGCLLQMDPPCRWRSEIRMSCHNLLYLIKAVDMLEGELPASLSFFVPDHHHKRIIGHGGKHIQKWMKTFGVYVKFSNHPTIHFFNATSRGFAVKYRSNVLIRTPAKNSHALEKMKVAILDLASEKDRTLGISKSSLGDCSYQIASVVPKALGIPSISTNIIRYNVGLLNVIKLMKNVPQQPSFSSLEASVLQANIEQQLEASIESLIGDVFSPAVDAKKTSSPLSSMENIVFNLAVSPYTGPASCGSIKGVLSSRMSAISRPSMPFSAALHSSDSGKYRDASWDSLLDHASISLGSIIPLPSERIASAVRNV